jgi:hypothetical protein
MIRGYHIGLRKKKGRARRHALVGAGPCQRLSGGALPLRTPRHHNAENATAPRPSPSPRPVSGSPDARPHERPNHRHRSRGQRRGQHRLPRRPRAAHRLSHRCHRAGCRNASRRLPRPCRNAAGRARFHADPDRGGGPPLPHRPPGRGPGPAHDPELFPRRHRAGDGGPLARGARSLDADRGPRRRPPLRARHRRQQGAVLGQPLGAQGRAGDARAAGVQRHVAHRDGGGNRLARARRGDRGTSRASGRRPPPGLRRPAPVGGDAHDLPRRAGWPDLPAAPEATHGRAAFRQFRRAPEKPGAGNGPCAHHDIRARGRGAGPRLDPGGGRPGLPHAPRWRHPRRRRGRRRLGHARPDPGGAGPCLVLGRDPRLHLRRPRPPGQCDPAGGDGLGAAAPRHGAGTGEARRSPARASGGPWLRRYRGDGGWRGLSRHGHAARSPRRGVRGGLGRTDHRQSARHPAVAGRLASE